VIGLYLKQSITNRRTPQPKLRRLQPHLRPAQRKARAQLLKHAVARHDVQHQAPPRPARQAAKQAPHAHREQQHRCVRRVLGLLARHVVVALRVRQHQQRRQPPPDAKRVHVPVPREPPRQLARLGARELVVVDQHHVRRGCAERALERRKQNGVNVKHVRHVAVAAGGGAKAEGLGGEVGRGGVGRGDGGRGVGPCAGEVQDEGERGRGGHGVQTERTCRHDGGGGCVCGREAEENKEDSDCGGTRKHRMSWFGGTWTCIFEKFKRCLRTWVVLLQRVDLYGLCFRRTIV